MKRTVVLMLVIFSLSIMFAEGSYAADNPCGKEIAKFCKDIQPGDGRVLRCLTLSEKDLYLEHNMLLV